MIIDPKSLRIGNLVQYDLLLSDLHGQITRVKGIATENVIRLDVDEQGGSGYYSKEHISPIPLTEEWLKAMGYQSPLGWVWNNKAVPGLVKIEDGDMWWCFGNDIVTEVPYVHSLQNLAFALTGQELTYTPEKV